MTLYCVCRKKLLVLGGKEDLTYWAWGENNSDTHNKMMANFLYQCKSQFEEYTKGSKEIPQLRCADLLRNACQCILCCCRLSVYPVLLPVSVSCAAAACQCILCCRLSVYSVLLPPVSVSCAAAACQCILCLRVLASAACYFFVLGSPLLLLD